MISKCVAYEKGSHRSTYKITTFAVRRNENQTEFFETN